MKMLKFARERGLLTAALSASYLALPLFADSAGTWVKREGVGTGGTDWTSWNDTDNWDGGTVASGSGSTAVATLSAATGQYIEIPSSLSLYTLTGVSSAPPVIRSDATLSLYRKATHCYLYAPIAFHATSDTDGLAGLELCGPISSVTSKTPLWGLTPNKFRFDLYATASGGNRVETAWPGNSINTWGATSIYFIAPHGSDTATTGNWSMTEGSRFLKRAAGQTEHVLSVGTTVTGAGIPDGTWLKRVFPDGTIEISAAATTSSASTSLTFAAMDVAMSATVNGNIHRGPSGSGNTLATIYVQKYRESDDFTVSIEKLRSANATWNYKIATQSGFLPGMFSLTGVQSSSAGTPLQITLENCHLKIAGDSFADAKFFFPGSTHTARMTVAADESHAMGALDSIKGTLVKDGAGKLSASLASTTANAYSGTIVVEEGVFTITNADVFISSVMVKSGATLDVPQGLHIGTLTTEDGAIISGGRVVVDADVAGLVAKVTEGKVRLDGAYILDAATSGKQLEISLVNGNCSSVKNGDDWVSTFATNSLIRVEGSGLVDVLVVGGGGGGGTMWGGGGGGGGVIYRQQVFLTNGWYGVAVGAGGAGTDARLDANASGGDSAFCGLIALGGGAGGTWWKCNGARNANGHYGLSGGSGGGGGIMYPSDNSNRSVDGGVGVPGQGHNGGRSFNYSSSFLAGGGGGGAGTAGENAATNSVGNFTGSCGGAGIACSITGVETYYGGGGGGAGNRTAEAGSGAGGVGGGGNGSFGSDRARGGNGTDGLGGGGGGGRAKVVDGDPEWSGGGGKGGRGVVILRYARIKPGSIIFVL